MGKEHRPSIVMPMRIQIVQRGRLIRVDSLHGLSDGFVTYLRDAGVCLRGGVETLRHPADTHGNASRQGPRDCSSEGGLMSRGFSDDKSTQQVVLWDVDGLGV